MLISLALRVGLQGHKYDAAVRGTAGEAEPGDGENPLHFRELAHHLLNLLLNVLGVLQRCSRGGLHADDQIALIFIRHESLGDALENQVGQAEAGDEQDDCHPAEA